MFFTCGFVGRSWRGSGDCSCLKGLQLFWCPTCCLTAGREGPVKQDSFPCQDFLVRKFFPNRGKFFPNRGNFFPNRGTFLISVGEFFRSAGHFSCRWDIFPVDRRQNFREGHGNPVCRSPQRAELLKTPGNRGPQGEGFSPEHGERPRQDMLRLRGTLVLPLAEARRGEGQDSSGILAGESRIRVLFCEKCGRGKTRGIQGQNMAVSYHTTILNTDCLCNSGGLGRA